MTSAEAIGQARQQIDVVDRRIVALLAERTRIVADLTEHKTDEATVRSPDRVQQVLDKVQALAQEEAMPVEIALATYRALIDALTTMQLERLAQRREQGLLS